MSAPKSADQTWCHVADQLRSRWPKLAGLMDEHLLVSSLVPRMLLLRRMFETLK